MTSRSLGHRAPLLWLPLIAGLTVGRYGSPAKPHWLLAGAAIAAQLSVLGAWRAPRVWALPLAAALLFTGEASYTLRRARLSPWELLPPREAQLAVRVDRVFPQADPRRTAGIATVTRAVEPIADLVGQRIYFSLALRRGDAAPIRSTVISAFGVLTMLPQEPAAGTFDSYLADAGINFRLARGRLLAVELPPTRYRIFCDHLAQRLNAILSAGVATKRPALAAVYRAMMLGQRHELSAGQDQLFMHSGTMHLFAINGLHIGVVALALHALFLLARCPRPLVAVLTLLVLWLDVDTSNGSQASSGSSLICRNGEPSVTAQVQNTLMP